ncbi:MAG: DEAD/DEAH box helicase [Oscillospiraceae bacterium]|nr:DEAD/DEAH box helicase [Oscillospiraceae bacterium]
MTDITTFEQLNLEESTIRAVTKMGFAAPTPVQAKTIPVMMEGRDVICKAPTGTGKTCAFGIPILEQLHPDLTDIQAVAVCPTRELCIQITEELRQLAVFRPELRVVPLYGGQPIRRQLEALKKRPQMVVATPGRLLDHMNRGSVWLGNVYTAVLDEADEMLKMGFIKDVRKILNATPADTQLVMFSATISRDVTDIAWEYLQDPAEINVEAVGDNRPKIAQYTLVCPPDKRIEQLLALIAGLDLRRVMVFCNRKSTVQWLEKKLIREQSATRGKRMSAECLHGDIPQSQRNRVMNGFRRGTFEILVCTDVAARGIDVDDVEAVVNFDIPEENEYYLHRIGRTGRAKRHGISVTFMTPGDQFRMRDIRKYCRSETEELVINEDGSIATSSGETVK